MRSLENTPIDRLAQKVAKSRIGRVVLPALMIAGGASACATPSQEIKPTTTISTPTAEPVHTPIAIGVSLPAGCQDDPNAVKGWEVATDKQHQLTSADNPSIDAFNACVTEANKPGEATATVIAATKPTTTPTTAPVVTEAPKPTPAVPEAKKDAPCNILPQEYCSQAEVIDWTNPAGEKSILIGIRIPAGVSEIPLLMPTDGKVTKAKLPDDSPIKGLQATVVNPNHPNPLWYRVYGDLKFSDMRSPDLKTGEIFGYIQKTGITNAGGYDALFSVLRGVGENTTKAEDEMKKMFPGLDFNKPTQKAVASTGSTATTINTTGYYKDPPAWIR